MRMHRRRRAQRHRRGRNGRGPRGRRGPRGEGAAHAEQQQRSTRRTGPEGQGRGKRGGDGMRHDGPGTARPWGGGHHGTAPQPVWHPLGARPCAGLVQVLKERGLGEAHTGGGEEEREEAWEKGRRNRMRRGTQDGLAPLACGRRPLSCWDSPHVSQRWRKRRAREDDDEAQEEGQEEGRENDQLVDEAQRVDRPVGAVLFSQVAPLGSRRRLQELDGALLPSLEAICICLQPGPPSPCLFSHRAAGLSTLTSLSGLAGRSRWHSRGPKKWPPARAEVEEKPRASQNHGVGGPGAGPASPEAPNSID
ncbi:unnamed protein product [Prorocentrum cordatum]|uniref:Uncharacterized protein n=1 Tax=Prorocentrum cordatum TaxID=2364126 RepID=A0ABN9UGA0_9DINO|nr:unnamed protein product [Polarella glacialis]